MTIMKKTVLLSLLSTLSVATHASQYTGAEMDAMARSLNISVGELRDLEGVMPLDDIYRPVSHLFSTETPVQAAPPSTPPTVHVEPTRSAAYSEAQMRAMAGSMGMSVADLEALSCDMSLEEIYRPISHMFATQEEEAPTRAEIAERQAQEAENLRLTLAFLEAEERDAIPFSAPVSPPSVVPSASHTQAAPVAPTCEAEEREFFELTNVARQRNGLPALVWNAVLGTVAREHSQRMAETFIFAHEIDGKSVGDRVQGRYAYSTVGENLFTSSASYTYSSHAGIDASSVEYASMQRAVDGLMDSPGHRENILRPEFTELGVGIFTNADGGQKYWTQVFGRPFSQPLR